MKVTAAVSLTPPMNRRTRIAGAFLFGSIAVGVGGSLGYEAYAIATGRAATISQITAGEIVEHPHGAVLGAFCAGGLASLLVAHFADLLKWWRP